MTENGGNAPLVRRPGVPGVRPATDAPGRTPESTGETPERPGEENTALPRDRNQAILEAAKQVGAILKRNGHRFALAGADLAVHGHAHAGTEHGMTGGGVRVRDVAQPVIGRAFHVYHLPVPERVSTSAGTGASG